MVTAASAVAQKLGYSTLKAKQMDVVMGIVSECDVFTTLNTRYGKSLCYGRLPYTYDKALFIISITSSRYHVARQWRFSSRPLLHMYNYAHTANHSYAIIVQFGNSNGRGSPDARQISHLLLQNLANNYAAE